MSQSVKEFLAAGGIVQKIEVGVRSLSARDMYLGVRGEKSAEQVVTERFGDSLSDAQYLQAVEIELIERG